MGSKTDHSLSRRHGAVCVPETYLSVIVHKGQGDFSVRSDICGVEGGADPALLDICEPALSALDIGIQRHYLRDDWPTSKR